MKKHLTVICLAAAMLAVSGCSGGGAEAPQTAPSNTQAPQSIAEKNEAQSTAPDLTPPLESDFEIADVDGGVSIVKYKGSGGSVKIPETIGGKTVRVICERAFYKCEALECVTVPDGVTKIENSAFYGCTSLSGINIPEAVTEIETTTFYECPSLSSISIPSGVTAIGSSAFGYCTSLTEVSIPDSVALIGVNAFNGCSALTDINVSPGSADYCSVDGVVFSKDKTVLYIYPGGKTDGTYTVPDSVKEIGETAFINCANLTEVIIPEGVTKLEPGTFSKCTGLTSINIPEGVTSVGKSAFAGCTSLTEISIPNGVTEIGEYAFFHCTGLVGVAISDSVTNIGEDAFDECVNIQATYKGVTYGFSDIESLYAAING